MASPVATAPPATDTDRILAAIGALPPRPSRPSLFLTIGLPASGKSSFARRLAREAGAVHLESDAIRRLLFLEPAHSLAENEQLFAGLHAAAARLLDDGVSVIIDATSIRERDRLPVYELAESRGLQPQLIYLTAPPSVIMERLARRLAERVATRLDRFHPEDSSTAGLEVYQRMAGRLQPVRRPHLVVDTASPASVDAAFQRLARLVATRLIAACQPADMPTANTGGARS